MCTLPLQGAEVEVEPAAQEHSTEMTVCATRHKCTASYNLAGVSILPYISRTLDLKKSVF